MVVINGRAVDLQPDIVHIPVVFIGGNDLKPAGALGHGSSCYLMSLRDALREGVIFHPVSKHAPIMSSAVFCQKAAVIWHDLADFFSSDKIIDFISIM